LKVELLYICCGSELMYDIGILIYASEDEARKKSLFNQLHRHMLHQDTKYWHCRKYGKCIVQTFMMGLLIDKILTSSFLLPHQTAIKLKSNVAGVK
jgi:hypothetical protein